MLSKIELYYKQAGVAPFLLKGKLQKLSNHPDILAEFAEWIEKKTYRVENCVHVEGYTAESIAAMSKFMDGEGAFMLLIELREAPQRAHQRIKSGFVQK